MKNLKTRLRQGEALFGCWLNVGSSITAEIVGAAGFDWVLIDFEHGAGSEQDILHQLQALEHTPAAAMVRVESSERQRAHRVLDFGAEGVMFPQIRNVEEARKVADAMRYQPEGIRGVAKMTRSSRFGVDFEEYRARQEEQLVGIVQIENEGILNSLDAVAAIEGVDVLFIGPVDLSLTLGTYGQKDHPRFREALRATADAARKAGKAAGVLMQSLDEFQSYYDLGFRFIACGSDSGFVFAGAHKTSSDLKTLRSKLNTDRAGGE